MDLVVDRRRANRVIAAIAAALLSLLAIGALAEATSGTHSISFEAGPKTGRGGGTPATGG